MNSMSGSCSCQFSLLQVSNLSVDYVSAGKAIRAVDGISFELNAGETLGIVGESGSGKTVTALAIMRLISPPGRLTGGTIIFNSTKTNRIDLTNANRNELQLIRGNRIAMIFQEPMTSLNPSLRCGYQICEPLLIHIKMNRAQARQRALQLLAEVQLPNPERVYGCYPHQLSGGQRQRVMIAMALACNPSLLIADEPGTALDLTVQKSINELLKNLQQNHKMAMIYISHDLGVVAGVADRVAVMLDGKIIENGSVCQVFSHPIHPYTKGLISCRPDMKSRPARLPVVADYFARNTGEEVSNQTLINASGAQKPQQRTNYDGEPLIKVDGLKVWFGTSGIISGLKKNTVRAVDGVSFEVYCGETLGLVGESGSGKTTLGRALLKLITPNEGSIVFSGHPLHRLRHAQLLQLRRQMQIIFQDPYSSLNPRLTVGQAIVEPMKVHDPKGEARKRIHRAIELLERVGLESRHFDRFPHEFSGGQRQRICIARTLALKPAFIICDESVSALDVSVQAQILNLLNDLKRDFGLTYIFISHDLAVVHYMADRIMVMKDGKIVESGETDSILSNPATIYTRSLIDSIPNMNILQK